MRSASAGSSVRLAEAALTGCKQRPDRRPRSGRCVLRTVDGGRWTRSPGTRRTCDRPPAVTRSTLVPGLVRLWLRGVAYRREPMGTPQPAQYRSDDSSLRHRFRSRARGDASQHVDSRPYDTRSRTGSAQAKSKVRETHGRACLCLVARLRRRARRNDPRRRFALDSVMLDCVRGHALEHHAAKDRTRRRPALNSSISRQPENALSDDIPLNLGRSRGDRTPSGIQPEVRPPPVPGRARIPVCEHRVRPHDVQW
jgi:hypothetical protein